MDMHFCSQLGLCKFGYGLLKRLHLPWSKIPHVRFSLADCHKVSGMKRQDVNCLILSQENQRLVQFVAPWSNQQEEVPPGTSKVVSGLPTSHKVYSLISLN